MASKGHGTAEAVLDDAGIESICDRLIAGETQNEICRKLKIAPGSMVRWLAIDPERARQAREARIAAARTWDELAGETIKGAKTVLDLGKARELASHYRWRAKMANPREYGDKVELTGKDGGAIDHSITVNFVSNKAPDGVG